MTGRQPNVVLLVVDACRFDYLRGPKTDTPNVDAFADEVEYADAVVGEILNSLSRHGIYDDTLVVLTADHGEGDGRALLDHQASVGLPLLRVPLVVRTPSVRSGPPRGPRPDDRRRGDRPGARRVRRRRPVASARGRGRRAPVPAPALGHLR